MSFGTCETSMSFTNEVRNLSYPDHDRIGKISRCARPDNDKIKDRDRPEDVQQPTNRGFFRALKPSIATQSPYREAGTLKKRRSAKCVGR